MQIGMRQFQNDDVEWFKTAAVSNQCSRYELAKRLCERVGWYNSCGEPSITQAYQALPKLADGLVLIQMDESIKNGGETEISPPSSLLGN